MNTINIINIGFFSVRRIAFMLLASMVKACMELALGGVRSLVNPSYGLGQHGFLLARG